MMNGVSHRKGLTQFAVPPLVLRAEAIRTFLASNPDSIGIKFTWTGNVPSGSSLMIWNGEICKSYLGGYASGDLAGSITVQPSPTVTGGEITGEYIFQNAGVKPGNRYCGQIWEDFYAGKEASNPAPVGDSDGDGFADTAEAVIGTDILHACAQTVSGGGLPSPTWPADLYTGSTPSFNRIDLSDLSSFVAPIRRLNTKTGDANFNKRWDLNADGVINLVDMAWVSNLYPPFYPQNSDSDPNNNVRAYNGPTCQTHSF